MPRSAKLCLDCMRPSRDTRCPTCTARRRTAGHGSAEYRRNARAVMDAHLRHNGNVCPDCGARTQDLTVDHIRPIARGGSHELTNLRVLCRSCNSRKGSRQ